MNLHLCKVQKLLHIGDRVYNRKQPMEAINDIRADILSIITMFAYVKAKRCVNGPLNAPLMNGVGREYNNTDSCSLAVMLHNDSSKKLVTTYKRLDKIS